MKMENLVTEMTSGQAALLLCIIGGKTEKENCRIFPNIDESLRYIEGRSELQGNIELCDDYDYSADDTVEDDINTEFTQLTLVTA